MKAHHYTAEQIIKILEQAERGEQTVGAVCREHGVAEATFYRWRKTYGGMSVAEAQRLKELEKENGRLKRLLAERMLEVDALKEVLAKKLTVAERREIVDDLVRYGCSVRRACELAYLQRATFHYQQRPRNEDELLVELKSLAQQHPRYGYRRAWAVLKRTGTLNRKRVHRLWKAAQLQLKRVPRPRNRRKRPVRPQAEHPNHIWAYDFVQDADRHANKLYILTVMDEFTREGLATHVSSDTSAEGVEAVLAALRDVYGTPIYLRSDNGAEFVALRLQGWLDRHGIVPLYIDPGCPWQNGKNERFNGTVRDECLNMQLFGSVVEARIRLEAFRQHYNSERPHSALAYQTPLAFKQAWYQMQNQQQDSLIST